MIECVLFDLGNVLALINTKKFYSVVRKHSATPSKWPKDRFRHFLSGHEAGILDEREFYERVCAEYLVSGLTFEKFWELFNEVIKPDPKMLELMRMLKRKEIRVGLITNIGRSQFLHFQNNHPEFTHDLDVISASYEMGVRKPDVEIYVRTLDHLGARAETCLFIDDYLDNITSFRALGGLGFHYYITGLNGSADLGKLKIVRGHLFFTFRHLGLI